MNKTAWSAAVVIALICNVFANTALAESVVVIVARPTHVEFMMAEGDLPENQGSGKVFVGGVYRTTLANKEILHGSLSQEVITVELVATSRENLSKAKNIVVLLTRKPSGVLVALGWNEPRTIACLPVAVAERNELTDTFAIELPRSQELCARLDATK